MTIVKSNGYRESTNTKGKHSVTHWKVLKRFKIASLMACRLETGRTHQIRVHCSSSGYPILGDEKYCPKSLTYRPGRLMLHASSIQFPGISSTQDKFEVGPDDNFLSIWEEFSSED